MQSKVILAALLGFFVLGNLVARNPDSAFIQLSFYVYAAISVGFIAHFYLTRWWYGDRDEEEAPPPPADNATPPRRRATWQPVPLEHAPPPPAPAAPNPAIQKDIPDALIQLTLQNLKATTSAPVREEVTLRAYAAQKGDVQAMTDFGQAFLDGDDCMKRDLPLAARWMGHAVAHGAHGMRPLLEWVQHCIETNTLPPVTDKNKTHIKGRSYMSRASAQAELDALIGLNSVKAQVRSLINRRNLEKLRDQNQLPSDPDINLHLVFTGNPGTGKTVVAQLLGALLANAGILPRGQVVEVSGVNLVGEYIGTTGPKVEDAVKRAMGGILFIDEAYALIAHVGVHGPQRSASMDAITTLLLEMNKHKGKFMVIAAGYPDEMKHFLEFNPGLKSRFRETLHFDNFSAEELVQIYIKIANDKYYKLAEGCRPVLKKIMEDAPGKYARNFGNARFVANLFEETLERVADRVAQKTDVTREELMTITPFDISAAAEDFRRQHKG